MNEPRPTDAASDNSVEIPAERPLPFGVFRGQPVSPPAPVPTDLPAEGTSATDGDSPSPASVTP